MSNPSKRDSAVRDVVSAARAIVTYQIGIPEGCKRMNRALFWLKPYESDLPTIFEEYLKAISGLPAGTGWDRTVLQEKDVALEESNQKFRNRIFDTCWAMIDRFSAPN